jgi:predicted nucleic-acid-binding protein
LIPYISNVVVLEIIFVLTKVYKFPKDKVVGAVNEILNMRNLTLIEKTNTKKALKLFGKYNIKYGDALIAAQVSPRINLLTYDKDFAKISSLSVTNPNCFRVSDSGRY